MSTSYQDFIRTTFDRFKRKNQWDSLVSLPVYAEDQNLVAFLRPITKDFRLTDPDLAEVISQWHIENPTISTGTFKVTAERTARWLDNQIVGRADRLLFLVESIDGTRIGHLGFSNFNFDGASGEVDSVLRGVKKGYPRIMSQAMRTLLHFGVQDLQMQDIRLSVFSDSQEVVNFYSRLGFLPGEMKPLYRVHMPDESKLEIAPVGYTGAIEKHYLYMIYPLKRVGDKLQVGDTHESDALN